jgi:phosphoribosyl-AMP cyclohydrolase
VILLDASLAVAIVSIDTRFDALNIGHLRKASVGLTCQQKEFIFISNDKKKKTKKYSRVHLYNTPFV